MTVMLYFDESVLYFRCTYAVLSLQSYTGWVRKVICWFFENMSIKLRRQEQREQILQTKNDIFTLNILRFNILLLKAVNEMTF